MMKDFPIYLKKSIEREMNGTRNQEESRGLFNEYGDRCEERKETQPGLFDVEKVYVIPYVGDETMNRLNAMSEYLKKRGAELVVAGFSIAYGELTYDVPNVQQLQSALEEKADFPIISNFEDYKFEYKYFYNSTLHLTDEGTKLRTEQLIKDLQKYMKQKE